MPPTTAQIIANELAAAGVRFVFGQPGGEVVDLIHAIDQAGCTFVLMGHESAASLAAGTMGQATGTPGVCLATLGPGACNLVLGVGDALLDRNPLLAISARTAADTADWFNHQNLDLNGLFAPITKASIALNGTDTSRKLKEAIRTSLAPPRGPVYLSLPGDIASQSDKEGNDNDGDTEPIPLSIDQKTVLRIQVALNRAERPVAVIGIALDQQEDGQSIRDFLEKTGLPYVDTPKAKGLVDPTSAAFLGTCLAASGDMLIAEVLRQSDCLIGIGFDPIETTYEWHRTDRYHGIANAPTDYGTYHPHMEAIGEVGAILAQLAQGYTKQTTWQTFEWAQLRDRILTAITPEVIVSRTGIAPYHVVRRMRDILPPDTCLSVDTGSHKLILAQAWHTNHPLTYFGSNGLSSMGTGVPGAIALALLYPDRPVVGVAGDGGFGMMVQELETVKRLNLSPLFVVLCDQSLSLIRIPYQLRNYEPIGINLDRVDWATVAEGYGIKGVWAHTIEELVAALTAWRETPQATVLAVQIDDALYCGNSY